ncbi:MAG: dTMP kinase [Candidatus Nanohaloarchaea archaeon]
MEQRQFPGNLIVVEGPDGSGTTTQAERLAERLDAVYTAEPGARREEESLIGEKVDEMISQEGYSPEAIALAFAADRMVHVEEKILPLLKEGETLVSDRYYHSSLVYQPALGANFRWVRKINRRAIEPDKTFILDVSAKTGMKRTYSRGEDGDIFESLSFQQEVVERYRRLPERLEERIELVEGDRPREEVSMDLVGRLPDHII